MGDKHSLCVALRVNWELFREEEAAKVCMKQNAHCVYWKTPPHHTCPHDGHADVLLTLE